jgi:hypothetical protein
MKKIPVYLLALLILASCVKQADWTIPPTTTDLIAVDGIMTNERGSQSITINHPVNQLNGTAVPVTGAIVNVLTSDSIWTLTENPSGSGIYRTSSTFIALLDKTYTLNIFLGSKVYSAKAAMTAGAVFPPLIYAKNDNDSLYHIEYVASAFSSSQPAMWEILANWTRVPGYEHADTNKCKARLLFYTLPTLDESEIFAPVVESVSFPAGTQITERRYSLAPQHAEFIREMLLETSWQGGLFPTAAANVSTNLSPGAVGFFGVCAVDKLSLIVVK